MGADKDRIKSTAAALSPGVRSSVAGILTWLVPGAGHVFLGERARGVILMATIAVTFWTGVAIGGVKNTVNYSERWGWFLGQICAGGHTLMAMGLSTQVAERPIEQLATIRAFGREEEISVVYTGICGMLNILVILDVLVRAERMNPVPNVRRAGPNASRGWS